MKKSVQTPREYFDIIVTPDVDDYFCDQGNIRKAFHACTSLDHMRDWVANYLEIDFREFTNSVRTECPALEEVRRISVNVKHLTPESAPLITAVASARSIKIGEVDIPLNEMLGTLGDYGSGIQIIAKETGKADTHILSAAINAYNYWKDFLFRKNL